MGREDRIHTVDGRLKRQANGQFNIRVNLCEADALLLEQWILDNNMMDDVPAAIRMLLLAAMRDPRWAAVLVDRRAALRLFRVALWTKMAAKITEVQNEMNDELMLLETEEPMPHVD